MVDNNPAATSSLPTSAEPMRSAPRHEPPGGSGRDDNHRAVWSPHEPEVDYGIVEQIKTAVNARIDEMQESRPLSNGDQRHLAQELIVTEISDLARERARAGLSPLGNPYEERLRTAVFSALFGLGRLEPLLSDPMIEDIIITGTRPVCLLGSDGSQRFVPPVADSDDELLKQLQLIATHHGLNERQVNSAVPLLNQRLPDGSRLAAMWTVTPEPQVVIRKHRYVDITLDQLVAMGLLSRAIKEFLQAAVAAKLNILVVGSPRSGKTTLLRALSRCLPATERFATLETEYELLLHELRDDRGRLRWPLLLACETRPGTGELHADGRIVGEVGLEHLLPQSLRMSVTRAIVGEARGPEVEPMLMTMLRGYPGSMSTFHANSPMSTFDGLAALLMTTGHSWTRESALHLIASALDVIVYVDYVETPVGWHRYVSEIIEVTGPGEGSRPATTSIFGPRPDLDPAVDPRAYPLGHPESTLRALRRVRFPLEWLEPHSGAWAGPFPALRRGDAA